MKKLLSKIQERRPTIRLAVANESRTDCLKQAPVVRLAHTPGAQGDGVLTGKNGVTKLTRESAPALLVSYVYLAPFLENQKEYVYRDWALDSGAFSAMNSGLVISVEEYTEKCIELQSSDPTLTEIFGLDVIGDWEKTLENCEYMHERGIDAIPTFHFGEPISALMYYKKWFPKIAIGGVARLKGPQRRNFVRQVFAHVWPHKLHGFGFGSEGFILDFPFHSVDATSWEIAACQFGEWRGFKGESGARTRMSIRGSKQNLRTEVEYYLTLEQKAMTRWKKEMALLEGAGAFKL